MTNVAAIVLAGGRAARFGRDKLREPIDGRPLLDLSIEAVRGVVDEVIVVAAPDAAPPVPTDVRVVHDARSFEGPLAGLANGLAATTADTVLVVGGDMPSLVPAVLRRLIVAVGAPGIDAAVLESGEGGRPLPMAVRHRPALALAETLLGDGERRLRSLRDGLRTTTIPEVEWRLDDPDGLTLRDIDVPADLG